MREFVLPIRAGALRALLLLLAIAVGGGGRASKAQVAPRLDSGGDIAVGGEAERYLRVLQLTGSVPLVPWSLQPFAASESQQLAPTGAHPWSARFAGTDTGRQVRWLRPDARAIVNTAFPFQEPVGPTWAGRGLTASIQAGLRATWGRMAVQLAPIAFLAQNAEFSLAPNGLVGEARFRDARYPGEIDFPQRFGDKAYGRVDLGSSSIAIDLPGVLVGASNAPQRWGPARDYPLVLGPAAGGFPHGFISTRAPVNIGIARVQARLIGGSLAQSAYSPATADKSHRFSAAALLDVNPRGLDGLELGFIRFFTTTNEPSLRGLLRPFSLAALVGAQGDTTSANISGENQIASVFFRWVFPTGGVEVYGEWYREDFPGDLRKLILKPDDLSDFEIGIQRVWVATPAVRRVFRFEIVNGELSHQERGQRGGTYPYSPYLHSEVVQGHTQNGLILGSPEAFGGAAWRIGLDEYTSRGRRSIGLERFLRFDQLPVQPAGARPDVLYGVRAELLRFAGGRDYGVTLVPALNLNRNLQPGTDVFNLHAVLSVRGW